MTLSNLKTPILLLSSLLLTSCFTDSSTDGPADISTDTVTEPDTYNFQNVSISGQGTRLEMLKQLKSEIGKANISGTTLDSELLKSIYSNSGNPFSSDELNSSGKQLKNKTFEAYQDKIDSTLEMAAAASQSEELASDSTPGLLPRGEKFILVDKFGKEFTQIIEKGLMGSAFLFQATGLGGYLDGLESDDNVTVTEGKGTQRQHHFDEAFGYFTNSVSFPVEGKVFWAKYAVSRTDDLNSDSLLLKAFIKARANMETGEEFNDNITDAVHEIRTQWELLAAAQAIHYLKSAKSTLATSTGEAFHSLSEAWAFIDATKFVKNSLTQTSGVKDIHDAIGENFWETTPGKLDLAISKIQEFYNFDQSTINAL